MDARFMSRTCKLKMSRLLVSMRMGIYSGTDFCQSVLHHQHPILQRVATVRDCLQLTKRRVCVGSSHPRIPTMVTSLVVFVIGTAARMAVSGTSLRMPS